MQFIHFDGITFNQLGVRFVLNAKRELEIIACKAHAYLSPGSYTNSAHWLQNDFDVPNSIKGKKFRLISNSHYLISDENELYRLDRFTISKFTGLSSDEVANIKAIYRGYFIMNDGKVYINDSTTSVLNFKILSEYANYKIKKIVTGSQFKLALTECGKLLGTGKNLHGQLGTEKNVNSLFPLNQINIPEPVGDIEVNASSCIALVGDEVYTWGENHNGMLGHPSREVLVPTKIPSFSGITHIACDSEKSIFKTKDQNIYILRCQAPYAALNARPINITRTLPKGEYPLYSCIDSEWGNDVESGMFVMTTNGNLYHYYDNLSHVSIYGPPLSAVDNWAQLDLSKKCIRTIFETMQAEHQAEQSLLNEKTSARMSCRLFSYPLNEPSPYQADLACKFK